MKHEYGCLIYLDCDCKEKGPEQRPDPNLENNKITLEVVQEQELASQKLLQKS